MTVSAVSKNRARIRGWRERRLVATAIAAGGTLAVAVVLVLNLRRLDPLLSLGAALAMSLYLWHNWVAHGRPGEVASVVR
jgi:hypothetical protein